MQTIQERILDLIEDRVTKADLASYLSHSTQSPNGGAIFIVDSDKELRCLVSMAYYFDALQGKIEFFLPHHAPTVAIQGDNPNAHRSCHFWYHDGKSVSSMLQYLDDICGMAKEERRKSISR